MATTYSYDDNAKREDLLSIITNLDFKENQLMSGLATSTAKSTLHQWLTDTLKAVAVNAAVEGADATYNDRTDPQRVTNWMQIVRVAFDVSDTERAIDTAGFNDRMAYEATKAMKEWKQDAEYALVRGSVISGTGSAARQMNGIKNFFVSHNITAQSGVTLTENALNDYLQNVWDDGTEVNAIYCPMYIKRKISGYTAGSTKFTDVSDRRLTNAVDVYQADAAKMVKLFAHRFVSITGTDTNYGIIGINEDMFRVAYLRKPFMEDRAKTGDSTKKEIVGELTLECLHQDAGFFADKHL